MIRRARLYVLPIYLNIVFYPSTILADDDWGLLSARLSPRMTEQQVMAAVGYRPNKVELQTCGGDTPSGPWSCKIFTFGSLYNYLRVTFFEDDSNIWRVNNWTVYP
jgi:hypothetical protein